MKNYDFTLKSGAVLHMTTFDFELAIALQETVLQACKDENQEGDVNVVIRSSPTVRKALYTVFPRCTYDGIKLYPGIFNEPEIGEKARGDYYEICSRIVETNALDFFLMISLPSTTPTPASTESPKQP